MRFRGYRPGMDPPPNLTPRAIKAFRKSVYDFYREHRRDLPWRRTRDPWEILISEFMLQQTQVSRVEEKYPAFLERFPDVDTLADAASGEVLALWQGLGYNRRALALHRTARLVVDDHNGTVPDSTDLLLSLPGIGSATAGALQAFAFDQPVVFIETNIRRVFIHSFFPDRESVTDREILPLVEVTVDNGRPREWYYALMDYGSMLTKAVRNPNLRSAHYSRQSPFEGSNRQIRGQILRILLDAGTLSTSDLQKRLSADRERVGKILTGLEKDGFLVREGERISIAP